MYSEKMKVTEWSNNCNNYEQAVQYLRRKNILRRQIPSCTICQREMTEVKVGRGEQKMWWCPGFLENHDIAEQDFLFCGLSIFGQTHYRLQRPWNSLVPPLYCSFEINCFKWYFFKLEVSNTMGPQPFFWNPILNQYRPVAESFADF